MVELGTSQFWIALLEIIGIDLILSGDNAVVIALACRSLPPHQRRWGIILGAGAAIVLRVVFAAAIVFLLAIPYLKLIGGLLLFWIAFKLLQPEAEAGHDTMAAKSNIWGAVQTIVIADAVMSLDNVIGIAAAAKGSVLLIVLGLLISIPLIIWGSTLILKLIDRYPIIIILGGALLGYIAGEIMVDEPIIAQWVEHHAPVLHTLAPIAGAILVVVGGRYLANRAQARTAVAAAESQD